MAALGLHCCARAFSSCRERGYSSLWCTCFSLRWLLLVWSTSSRHVHASVVVARGFSSCGSRALECRIISCGTWAQMLHGMWDPPRPGIEPVLIPALAGGFSTTAPPGKSPDDLLKAHKVLAGHIRACRRHGLSLSGPYI